MGISRDFDEAVYQLLKQYGPQRTSDLYPLLEESNPHLISDMPCTHSQRNQMEWQHELRRAQHRLKKEGLIRRSESGQWTTC